MSASHAPFAVALSLGLLAAIAPATASAHDATLDGSKKLQIEIGGTIAQHCGMGDIPDANLGDISGGGFRIRADMALDCNVPFDLTFRSANGGLAHETMPEGQGPYSGRLTYQMKVDLPVRSPQARIIQNTFNTDQMRAGAVVSSQDGISNGAARLNLDIAPPTGAGLLAGRYSETITVTLTPRT